MSTLYYSAFFDSSTINSGYTLTESGITYLTASNGTFNAPNLFSTGAYSGKSIEISIPQTTFSPASDGKTTDRFEYEWVQQTDPSAPRFDRIEKYLGFAFKIIGAQTG